MNLPSVGNNWAEADAAYPSQIAEAKLEDCSCRGGWILSPLDSWHQCPHHYEGQRHPEMDED